MSLHILLLFALLLPEVFSDLAATRYEITLVPTLDNTHKMIPLYFGDSNNSTAPGSPLQLIYLIVDTGSNDLLLFKRCQHSSNTGACYDDAQNSYPACCYFPLPTADTPLPVVIFDDNEQLKIYKAIVAQDIVVTQAKITGTNTNINMGNYYSYSGNNPAKFQPIAFFQAQTALVQAPLYDSDAAYSFLNKYDGVAGVFGMTYPVLVNGIYNVQWEMQQPYAHWQYLFNTYLTDPSNFNPNSYNQNVISLDYSRNKMFIGGIDPIYRSSLAFSSTTYNSGASLYHSFRITSMSLAGGSINLFASAADSIPSEGQLALVDSGTVGLQLPAEIFDSLLSWLPVLCDQALGDNDNSIVCWMPSTAAMILPTLEFTVESGAARKILYISLSDLIYPSSSNPPNRIAITRTSALAGASDDNPLLISFGSLVMRSLFTVLDIQNHRVGFANTKYKLLAGNVANYYVQGAVQPSNSSIRNIVSCSGMQVHLASLNICLDPPCSDYFLFDYDASTKECRLAVSFHVMLAILITVFLLVELAMNESLLWMMKKVETEVEISQQ
jgi:hypothetical protein